MPFIYFGGTFGDLVTKLDLPFPLVPSNKVVEQITKDLPRTSFVGFGKQETAASIQSKILDSAEAVTTQLPQQFDFIQGKLTGKLFTDVIEKTKDNFAEVLSEANSLVQGDSITHGGFHDAVDFTYINEQGETCGITIAYVRDDFDKDEKIKPPEERRKLFSIAILKNVEGLRDSPSGILSTEASNIPVTEGVVITANENCSQEVAARGNQLNDEDLASTVNRLIGSEKVSELLEGVFTGNPISMAKFNELKERLHNNANIDNRDKKYALLNEYRLFANALLGDTLQNKFSSLLMQAESDTNFFTKDNFDAVLKDIHHSIETSIDTQDLSADEKQKQKDSNTLVFHIAQLELIVPGKNKTDEINIANIIKTYCGDKLDNKSPLPNLIDLFNENNISIDSFRSFCKLIKENTLHVFCDNQLQLFEEVHEKETKLKILEDYRDFANTVVGNALDQEFRALFIQANEEKDFYQEANFQTVLSMLQKSIEREIQITTDPPEIRQTKLDNNNLQFYKSYYERISIDPSLDKKDKSIIDVLLKHMQSVINNEGQINIATLLDSNRLNRDDLDEFSNSFNSEFIRDYCLNVRKEMEVNDIKRSIKNIEEKISSMKKETRVHFTGDLNVIFNIINENRNETNLIQLKKMANSLNELETEIDKLSKGKSSLKRSLNIVNGLREAVYTSPSLRVKTDKQIADLEKQVNKQRPSPATAKFNSVIGAIKNYSKSPIYDHDSLKNIMSLLTKLIKNPKDYTALEKLSNHMKLLSSNDNPYAQQLSRQLLSLQQNLTSGMTAQGVLKDNTLSNLRSLNNSLPPSPNDQDSSALHDIKKAIAVAIEKYTDHADCDFAVVNELLGTLLKMKEPQKKEEESKYQEEVINLSKSISILMTSENAPAQELGKVVKKLQSEGFQLINGAAKQVVNDFKAFKDRLKTQNQIASTSSSELSSATDDTESNQLPRMR